jgi:hypothetical protein
VVVIDFLDGLNHSPNTGTILSVNRRDVNRVMGGESDWKVPLNTTTIKVDLPFVSSYGGRIQMLPVRKTTVSLHSGDTLEDLPKVGDETVSSRVVRNFQ